jgi:hypothetical protein
MTTLHSINLPFDGFYESMWSEEVDHIQEREAEYRCEREREEIADERLHLDESFYHDAYFWCADYSDCYLAIARQYVAEFDHMVSEELGFPLCGEFDGMESPREYNFGTDRLFMKVPFATVERLFAISAEDQHMTLASVIAERHTSRSGFISFYDHVLADWLEKPLADWDHNELGTLIRAVLRLRGIEGDDRHGESLHWRMFEAVCDGEYIWEKFQECIDWEKFDAKVADARAEKLAEITADEPEYVIPYRCDQTLDLFSDYRPEVD